MNLKITMVQHHLNLESSWLQKHLELHHIMILLFQIGLIKKHK